MAVQFTSMALAPQNFKEAGLFVILNIFGMLITLTTLTP
jgi:hypothetical protein